MAGYSGTPLVKKLGIKEKGRCYVSNPPEGYFDWISPLPEDSTFKEKASGQFDFIHVFTADRKSFEKEFMKLKKLIVKDGMLWVSWPKKSSKMPTDLDENIIRDFGLTEGLVDVKVCAVNDVWSGLKFVIRLKDRQLPFRNSTTKFQQS
jgi:hypothetical protein